MNRFIGIPYADHGRSFAGVDCWGLVDLYYREVMGIELPDYAGVYASADDQAGAAVALAVGASGGMNGWTRVASRDLWQPGDVLTIRIGRFVSHTGVYIGADFLHCMRGRLSARESSDGFMWKHNIMGAYRWMVT